MAMTAQMIGNFAIVGLGGAIGAMCRYAVQNIGVFDDNPYYYTVAINVSGCFLIGVLWSLLTHAHADPRWFLFLLTGVLGGYTTYSAFTLDAMQLLQQGLWQRSLAYIAVTLFGGLAAAFFGLFGTERILHMF
ncbi:MAG: fluoride efflux transporter CrcB [Bacteroidales bacterium]|nr:fluoride efflux transporter CrcB [Bacteroidales bacterium]